jgi:hypothetical protein
MDVDLSDRVGSHPGAKLPRLIISLHSDAALRPSVNAADFSKPSENRPTEELIPMKASLITSSPGVVASAPMAVLSPAG